MKHQINTELRDTLATLRTEESLTNSQIAAALGVAGISATNVSKFLNDNYDRDPAPLEAAVADFLKARSERKLIETAIFDTSVTRSITTVLDTVRRTSDFALITGPAGSGKTKAAELYHGKHPTTVHATPNAARRDAKGIEAAVFDAVEHRSWKGNVSRWKFLVDRFAASNRLIMVDQAQRLDMSALRWLFDFHDETGCPVALFGNPELLDKLSDDSQLYSRIGMSHPVSLKDSEIAEVARRVAAQFLSGSDDVVDLAAIVAKHAGHLRAVRKQSILAQQLLDMGATKSAEQAFRLAHTKLVRNYSLPT
jgi:DNA transposition AAA+ family ATPase